MTTRTETYLKQRAISSDSPKRDKMTVAELTAECVNRGVTTKSKDTKETLMRRLRVADLDDASKKLTPRQLRRIKKKGM